MPKYMNNTKNYNNNNNNILILRKMSKQEEKTDSIPSEEFILFSLPFLSVFLLKHTTSNIKQSSPSLGVRSLPSTGWLFLRGPFPPDNNNNNASNNNSMEGCFFAELNFLHSITFEYINIAYTHVHM